MIDRNSTGQEEAPSYPNTYGTSHYDGVDSKDALGSAVTEHSRSLGQETPGADPVSTGPATEKL